MFVFFFFNDTATTEIYTLSLHDALPIWTDRHRIVFGEHKGFVRMALRHGTPLVPVLNLGGRSEEHTSELQSHSFISYAVFCLKKKKTISILPPSSHTSLPSPLPYPSLPSSSDSYLPLSN